MMLSPVSCVIWILKNFDIVIGDRNLPESVYFERSHPLRKAASGVFSFFVARFVTGGVFDTQCGIKAFKASVAQDIFSVARIERFSSDIEVLYVALKRNYDIKRLPVRLRFNEISSVRMVADSISMVLDIFRIRWNYTLGRYRSTAKSHQEMTGKYSYRQYGVHEVIGWGRGSLFICCCGGRMCPVPALCDRSF